MKLTVVGCSGSAPGPESSSSCYLVEADGFRMVLDLGSGALGPLQRFCGYGDLDAVLLSHLHPDHCMDVLPLFVARSYGGSGFPKLPIYGPEKTAAHLARAYGRREKPGLTNRFDFREWSKGTHQIGPFTVTVGRVAHPVPTWAMRVEHGGATLAYSADTSACAGLVELARGADLAIIEASFQDGKDDDAPAGLHLTGREAGEHARQAEVGRLLVTHVPPWNDAAVTFAAAAHAFGGPTQLAASGATYRF